jgi:signal transduction histidine kinase
MIIAADSVQLTEVFHNILGNAYQAFPDKTGEIAVSAKKKGPGSLAISIQDNGVGIDRENLVHIFEPFFTTKAKGTGLGLTICNEMVKMHNGNINIKSKVGKGTTVTITLPINYKT